MKADCLRTESRFIGEHPSVGMVYCAVDRIDKNGSITHPARPDPTPAVIAPDLAAQIMFFHGSIAGNIANVLLRKEVLNQVGSFSEEMKISADFEMWVRISQRYPIGHIDKPLIYLRNHSGQLSAAKGSFVISMAEDQLIYQFLMRSLPPEIKEYSLRYHRLRRGTMYWHHMVHCLISRDLRNALRSFRTIRGLGVNRILLAVYWLFTVNQKLHQLRPRYTRSVANYFGGSDH
jgi:hypothetical protein